MAVDSQIVIASILVDLNLSLVRDHNTNICEENNLVVDKEDCQTAKFKIFRLYGMHT